MIDQAAALNELARVCHEANKKWWADLNKPCAMCDACGFVMTALGYAECPKCNGLGYARKNRNVGELLMLCVSELAEADEGMPDNPERAMALMAAVRSLSRALEGHRKDLPDEKLPHRKAFEVEIADCMIRLFDLCAGCRLDIGRAFVEKMNFNAHRADHKIEHRLGDGGKKY